MKEHQLADEVCCGGHPLFRGLLVAASALLALLLANSRSLAQPGLSGLPLDNFQFKASHNSFEKDELMDDQLDNYNCWALELDLTVDSKCVPYGIHVYHPAGGRDLCLDEAIQEILRANDLDERVTFIWLDVTNPEPWPANRRELFRSGMLALGADRIYPKKDFEAYFALHQRWPSWQHIHKLGKRFILVLEDTQDGPVAPDDDLFFIAAPSFQEATSPSQTHATFINSKNADLANGNPALNDRWLYRSYPGFGSHDTETWENGVSRLFNLVGTDDIDQEYTILDSRTHSPQPLYVNRMATTRLWGTRGYPMRDLPTAILRASPGVTLRLRPDNYPSPVSFAKPMVVQKDPRYAGIVVLGRP